MSPSPSGSTRTRVALVGAGAWGMNLLRVLDQHPSVELCAVVDPSPEALARAAPRAPSARLFSSLEASLSEPLDAVVIASPAEHHAQAALLALSSGLDVLVEKPLATRSEDADAIVELAHRQGKIAMVGHLLLHHPAVAALLSLVRRGLLGAPRYLASARLSPPGRRAPPPDAPKRGDDSVLWALGPHDLSVLHALDPSPLASARSLLASPSPASPPHVALVQVRLASGLPAQLELSRVHAFKERRLLVAGDEAVVLFDDVRPTDKLLLARTPRGLAPEDLLRHGPPAPSVVPIEAREPLAAEVDHFIACVQSRARPLTPAEDGALIVRWLEEAERGAEAGPEPRARG